MIVLFLWAESLAGLSMVHDKEEATIDEQTALVVPAA